MPGFIRTYPAPEISSRRCSAAITAEVGRLGGVTSVEVDLGEQRVTVVGSVLDDGAIRPRDLRGRLRGSQRR
jgi:copper chaperone CopZ